MDSPYSKPQLSKGNWYAVQANKNHESTIQNKLVYKDGSNSYDNWYGYKVCDGIDRQSHCDSNTAYKATCNEHYVWYADTQQMCVAKKDDDGNLVEDDNGEPIGICDDCGNFICTGWRNLRGGGDRALHYDDCFD